MSDSSREERLSLELLADRTEVSPRQIRELVRLGVVPAPSSGGRGATYGTEHVDRLRAWKRLREESPTGTTNEQIRVLLERLQDAGLLRSIADGSIPFSLVDDQSDDVSVREATFLEADSPSAPRSRGSRRSPGAGLSSEPGPVNDDAVAYLRSVRAGTTGPPARVAMQTTSMRPTLEMDLRAAERSGAGLSLIRLRAALEEYVDRHAAGVRVNAVRSETWQRVTVGRDLEIVARGPLSPEEAQLLETIGQLLQQAIYRK